MKPLTYRQQDTYDYQLELGEVNNEPSMTVEDDSLTVNELLENYVKGVNVPDGKPVIYSDTDDFDNVDETSAPDFDLSDYTTAKNAIISKNERKAAEKLLQQSENQAENKAGTGSSEADDQPRDV